MHEASRSAALGAALLLGLGSCNSAPSGGETVTPQRPTLSSDTSTTAEGTFELEAGVAVDPSEAVDTPLSLKFGAGPSTEVFLSGAPFLFREVPGRDARGPGDVVVGLRHRFLESAARHPSAAFQASIKLPTADEELGSEEVDLSVAAMATQGFGDLTVTGYYDLGVLGDPGGGTDVSHSLALATSHPLSNSVGAFAEIAGVSIPDQDAEQAFTTFGVTYAASNSLVFDVGAVVGLDRDARDFQFIIGLTRNLGRLDAPRATLAP